MALAGGDRTVEWPAGAAGERDDVARFALEPFELKTRRLVRAESRKARDDSRIRLR